MQRMLELVPCGAVLAGKTYSENTACRSLSSQVGSGVVATVHLLSRTSTINEMGRDLEVEKSTVCCVTVREALAGNGVVSGL